MTFFIYLILWVNSKLVLKTLFSLNLLLLCVQGLLANKFWSFLYRQSHVIKTWIIFIRSFINLKIGFECIRFIQVEMLWILALWLNIWINNISKTIFKTSFWFLHRVIFARCKSIYDVELHFIVEVVNISFWT